MTSALKDYEQFRVCVNMVHGGGTAKINIYESYQAEFGQKKLKGAFAEGLAEADEAFLTAPKHPQVRDDYRTKGGLCRGCTTVVFVVLHIGGELCILFRNNNANMTSMLTSADLQLCLWTAARREERKSPSQSSESRNPRRPSRKKYVSERKGLLLECSFYNWLVLHRCRKLRWRLRQRRAKAMRVKMRRKRKG